MLYIRKAEDRFHTDFGWLDSHHTFSFGEHHDPRFQGFRNLLVINDDTVAAGGGFPTHGHRDMEIVSYVLDGALGHKDSMGTGSVIRPGDVQRMSAGTGVRHSEMNAADTPTHFLQIWFLPDRKNHEPSYEQKRFPDEVKRDTLKLVASNRKDRGDAVLIHSDAELYATLLSPGARVEHALAKGRNAWVHVARGSVKLNGHALAAGDGVAIEPGALPVEAGEDKLVLEGVTDAEVLVFDLA